MSRIALERRIEADPSSAALLIAGPAALGWWPYVESVAGAAGDWSVHLRVPGREPGTLRVHVAAPRRTPTSFVCDFTATGDGIHTVAGSLTLAYAANGPTGPATSARLVLHAAADADLLLVSTMARGFLDRLASVAEGRASAA
jgi:hypothetical protein